MLRTTISKGKLGKGEKRVIFHDIGDIGGHEEES